MPPGIQEMTGRTGALATLGTINNTQQVAPVVILELPIPPGFVADGDNFSALVRNQTVTQYQLTPRSVVVYVRELGSDKTLQLHCRL